MNDDMIEIGQRIRALMDERGETQAQLAEVLDVDPTAVSKLLAGRRGLAASELVALCEHYAVKSDSILFGKAEGRSVGALLRADLDADATRIIERVEKAFEDYLYVRALIRS
jgi:transcriptional regulator with XRE-family HTH domain